MIWRIEELYLSSIANYFKNISSLYCVVYGIQSLIKSLLMIKPAENLIKFPENLLSTPCLDHADRIIEMIVNDCHT